jgi:dTDP-4-dehydrorhamnose reductase
VKILVTGREGQVARSLLERAALLEGVEVEAVGRPELDLADPASVIREITARQPDIVVSAAAYTAVDKAEDEPELAMAVNAAGAEAVARAAAMLGVPVIHLSTDYVFGGERESPYAEDDEPAPRSVYGRTKLAGELAVAAANPRHVILRTAWLYSPFGRTFVKVMLSAARQREEIQVVSDQWGNPTSALDVADGILHVARRVCGGEESFGLFHLAAAGDTSWSGFAEHIFEASRDAGGPFARVKPIPTSEYPAKAKRPLNSRLVTDKLSRIYKWQAPDGRASCELVVRRLLQER